MTGAADPAMTGEENLRLMADLEHPGQSPPNRQGDT
jgi:hypothetical protein